MVRPSKAIISMANETPLNVVNIIVKPGQSKIKYKVQKANSIKEPV